jgi:hypothetical protein
LSFGHVVPGQLESLPLREYNERIDFVSATYAGTGAPCSEHHIGFPNFHIVVAPDVAKSHGIILPHVVERPHLNLRVVVFIVEFYPGGWNARMFEHQMDIIMSMKQYSNPSRGAISILTPLHDR